MNAIRSVVASLSAVALVVPALADTPSMAPTVGTAKVTINFSHPLGTVPQLGLGLGVAVWDGHMTDSQIPGIVKSAGFSIIRYPGGSYADIYHWKTNAPTKGLNATIQPQDDFDHYIKIAQAAHTQTLITVNYGSNIDGTGGGDPAEAAEWVKHANVDHHWGVRYWEIGNEVYGNGEYGAKWEEDLHTDKSPSEYGKNVNKYVAAMKAVDPSVKIGAVLTSPDAWPDGRPPAWNPTVLAECGKNIDFVVIHWYPDQGHKSSILDAIEANVPNMGAKARVLVDKYCRPHTPIWISEGDASGFDLQTQGALFAADLYPTLWENGIESFEWWDLHNGLHVNKDGVGDDQGILSNASVDKGVSEPEVNTPFPPYYGVQLVHRFASPDDTLIETNSNSPSILAHTVRKKNGRIALMLINKGAKTTVDVTVDGGRVRLGQADLSYFYGRDSKAVVTTGMDGLIATRAKLGVVKLPPLSVTVIEVSRLK